MDSFGFAKVLKNPKQKSIWRESFSLKNAQIAYGAKLILIVKTNLSKNSNLVVKSNNDAVIQQNVYNSHIFVHS